jgi:transposase
MAVLGPPMLTQEQAVEVRVLKRQGKSIRANARELGLSRVTVRSKCLSFKMFLRLAIIPRMIPRNGVGSSLEVYYATAERSF